MAKTTNRQIEQSLKSLAKKLKARVRFEHISDKYNGTAGLYYHATNSCGKLICGLIRVDTSIKNSKRLVILAHELGHHIAWNLYSNTKRRANDLSNRKQYIIDREIDAWDNAYGLLRSAGFTNWKIFKHCKTSGLNAYRNGWTP